MDALKTLGIYFIAGALLGAIVFGRNYAFAGGNYGTTPCDEWANFTKIITYKFRDNDFEKQAVKQELTKTMSQHQELPIALRLIDFTYSHPKLDSEKVWNAVFDDCKLDRSI